MKGNNYAHYIKQAEPRPLGGGVERIGGPGCGRNPFLRPEQRCQPSGFTSDYDEFRTIGCPVGNAGSALSADVKPATGSQTCSGTPSLSSPKKVHGQCQAGECYVLIVKDPVYRTEQVKKLVKEAASALKSCRLSSRREGQHSGSEEAVPPCMKRSKSASW